MSLYICPNSECTMPRMNCNVNYELCMIMMCQSRLINCNECTSLVRDVNNEGGYAYIEQGLYGKSLYFPLCFAVNLKLVKKYFNKK